MSGLLGWIQHFWSTPSIADSRTPKQALGHDPAFSQQYSHSSSQKQQTSRESAASPASSLRELPGLPSIPPPLVVQNASHPMQSFVHTDPSHSASLAINPSLQVTSSSSSSSSSSDSYASRSWRQSMRQAATKLSCKTVLDPNTRLCSAELAWHVRLKQQPARLAAKLSNKHSTRVTFDAQVGLCRSSTHMLRLAGTPEGLHSASLLIKPARLGSNPSNACTPGGNPFADTSKHGSTDSHTWPSITTSSPPCDSSATAHAGAAAHASCMDSTSLGSQGSVAASHETASMLRSYEASSSHSTLGESSSTAGCPGGTGHPQPQQLFSQHMGSRPCLESGSHTAENNAGSSISLVNNGPATPRRLRTRRRAQQGRPAHHPRGHPEAYSTAYLFRQTEGDPTDPKAAHQSQPAATGASPGPAAGPPKRMSFAAQLQWEIGWNWRVGGPLASVTKQLDPAASSSGPSALLVQQLKAAYDPKARSYTLTAGGAGWNVLLAVPTQAAGISGLVPRVWCTGCKPKLTLNLVPELACF